MRCIEISCKPEWEAGGDRLIETWDVLKSSFLISLYGQSGINRNMRCIEMAEDDFKVESANND